jgi:hypothetical protein
MLVIFRPFIQNYKENTQLHDGTYIYIYIYIYKIIKLWDPRVFPWSIAQVSNDKLIIDQSQRNLTCISGVGVAYQICIFTKINLVLVEIEAEMYILNVNCHHFLTNVNDA